MPKTEVYSWRASSDLKAALAEAARAHKVSVSVLLERVVRNWLLTNAQRGAGEQEAPRARALRFVGSLRGGAPGRAAEARRRIRTGLKRRLAR